MTRDRFATTLSTLSPPSFDPGNLRRGRAEQLRTALRSFGVDIAVLTNPVSIRYATDYRGYATFQSRIPSQYLLFPADGPVVLHGAYTNDLETIDASEVAHSITTFDAGLKVAAAAKRFVADVDALARRIEVGPDPVVGVERTTPEGYAAFAEAGIHVIGIEPIVEYCRSQKTDLELAAIRHSIDVAELAISRMRHALRPGITENALFSILHATNIAHDGDWIDGRMLCSGPRTNPWYQEASGRRVADGDLVAFDTDMIGPFGYCADISRTFVCGGKPSTTQRDLYQRARDEIEHNTSLLHVGASFRELSAAVLRHPPEFVANRYACAFHGVGMTDEYPKIPYPHDWSWTGYDGEIEEGVVLAVESYVGASGGDQGVKLEQMVQVTRDRVVPLSTYPLWD